MRSSSSPIGRNSPNRSCGDRERAQGVLVLDGRTLLDAERISSAGLRYRSVGRFAEAGSDALPVAI